MTRWTKVIDMPPKMELVGLRFRFDGGEAIGWIASAWSRGIWVALTATVPYEGKVEPWFPPNDDTQMPRLLSEVVDRIEVEVTT